MTMLVLTHRLFEAVTAFRAGSWVASANRSPITEPAPAEMVYPLAELDRMLPQCDTVLIACALAPETRGLIDARRLALLKPGTLVINVARAAIVDEDALYDALKDGHLGGAALDVWWQYPTAAEPNRRPSRRPFHELPNVLMTPHSSSSSDAKRNGAGARTPLFDETVCAASHQKSFPDQPRAGGTRRGWLCSAGAWSWNQLAIHLSSNSRNAANWSTPRRGSQVRTGLSAGGGGVSCELVSENAKFPASRENTGNFRNYVANAPYRPQR